MNGQVLQQPRLEQATITIASISPAPAAGKSARIKDTEGVFFGIWPDKLGNAAPCETYAIEFTAKVVNGTTWRDIKSMKKVADAPVAQAQVSRPTPAKADQYYRPTAPKDARRMFLCSTLNAFIQTGRVDMHREHLKQAIGEILAAYDATVALEDSAP